MAKSANLAYTVLNSSPHHLASSSVRTKTKALSIIQTCNSTATAISATSSSNKSKHLHSPLIGKTSRAPKPLITISTGDGKWHGEWTSDYKFSLQDLQLQDLVEVEEDKEKNAGVLVSLSIQKVIYVRPGYEADLDSLIQETIRLNTPVKDTCSELCEKSQATLKLDEAPTRCWRDKQFYY